jgi:phosphatidate cytidylyltransferase
MLKQRVITALFLAIFFIAALFWSPDWLWQGLILLVAGIAAWEWAGLGACQTPLKKVLYSVLVIGLLWGALSWLTTAHIFWLTLIEAGILLWVVLRYQRSQGHLGLGTCGLVLLTGILSIVLFALVMIRFRAEFSPEVLLASLMVIWAIDTGAYFSGRRFGKTKLAVFVSPGKTWEGVWGGTLLAFLVGLVGLYWLAPQVQLNIMLFALVLALIALFSVLGDLFESVLKRQANLKDSGSILPGHGGVLDRVDSLLIAVPMLYLAWSMAKVVA